MISVFKKSMQLWRVGIPVIITYTSMPGGARFLNKRTHSFNVCENFKHCIQHTWKIKNSILVVLQDKLYSARNWRTFPNTQLGRVWQLSKESSILFSSTLWSLSFRYLIYTEASWRICVLVQASFDQSSEEVLAVLWRPYTVAWLAFILVDSPSLHVHAFGVINLNVSALCWYFSF